MKKLIYVTYQTFPANTANSLQTISNIAFLNKNKCDIDLYFPLREKTSSGDYTTISNYYSVDTKFNVFGLKHNYPHGKVQFLKPLFYHISHFLWSKNIVKQYFKQNSQDFFITRSDWIAYFLGKQGSSVVFEVHQTSKLRRFILKKLSTFSNVKIIFLHENLKKKYEEINNNKNIVLHNGVDASLFNNNVSKEKNKIVFLGKLTRFNQTRGIEQLITFFREEYVKENFSLDIVGCSKKEQTIIMELIKKHNLEDKITTFEWLNRKDAITKIQTAEFGLLLNTPENEHSYLYTSPLKYFEYLYGGLKVLAVDFPSHKDLPLSKNINFFNLKDTESFIEALKNAKEADTPSSEELSLITLDSRAKKIIDFIF